MKRARSRRHTLSSDCTDADGIVGVGARAAAGDGGGADGAGGVVDLMRLMVRQCWPSSMMLLD